MAIVLTEDSSYKKFLASEFSTSTTTLEDTDMKQVVLVVDTATWYVYYKGTWYAQ